MKQTKILFITRPISPPWDEGSKNLSYNISKHINNFIIYLLSNKKANLSIKKNIIKEDIYINNKLSLLNKTILLNYLLKKNHEIKIFHLFFTPKAITSSIIKKIVQKKNKIIIQNIPSVNSVKTINKNTLIGNTIICLSDYSKNKLNLLGFNNVKKIYPGIDINKFKQEEKNLTLSKKLNISTDEKIILYPGNFYYQDEIRMLTNLIKYLKEKNNRFKFIFACRDRKDFLFNESNLKKKARAIILKNNLKESTIFLETICNMKELINLSDIVVFPLYQSSRKLDIPMILLESMACKKPIIITDIPPINEIFKKEVGFRIKPKDDNDFFIKTELLINNKELRDNMGENGRKVVEKYFDIKNIAQKYNKIYNEFNL
ncbi:MAG: glycosyltransferase family 4 protein [Candidatus Pacebacteria bacterium]|nr:glycosyltransferase family 4 protein [Candidatus Paceibacterota bacterium]